MQSTAATLNTRENVGADARVSEEVWMIIVVVFERSWGNAH